MVSLHLHPLDVVAYRVAAMLNNQSVYGDVGNGCKCKQLKARKATPFTFPPMLLIVPHFVYHCVVHSDSVAFGRTMEVRNSAIINFLHPVFEWRAMPIVPCSRYALQEDVGVDHLVD